MYFRFLLAGGPPADRPLPTRYCPPGCILRYVYNVGKADAWVAFLPAGVKFGGHKSKSCSIATPAYPATGRSQDEAEEEASRWLQAAEDAGVLGGHG